MPNTISSLNGVQIAERVGITEGGIRKYAKEFDVPSWKTPTGQRHYSIEMIPVFQQIRSMREQGVSSDNIKLNVSDALNAERDRIRGRPEGYGIDSKTLVYEVVEQMQGEIQDSGQALLNQVLVRLTDEYGRLREDLGASNALLQVTRMQLEEAQQKVQLLPAQAESLLQEQNKVRQAEDEARWLQNQQASLASELESAQSQIQELNQAQQGTQKELAQAELARQAAELERKHTEQLVADLRQQLDQAQANERAQAEELSQAKIRIGTLERELETEREALATERRKTWLDKLTKK